MANELSKELQSIAKKEYLSNKNTYDAIFKSNEYAVIEAAFSNYYTSAVSIARNTESIGLLFDYIENEYTNKNPGNTVSEAYKEYRSQYVDNATKIAATSTGIYRKELSSISQSIENAATRDELKEALKSAQIINYTTIAGSRGVFTDQVESIKTKVEAKARELFNVEDGESVFEDATLIDPITGLEYNAVQLSSKLMLRPDAPGRRTYTKINVTHLVKDNKAALDDCYVIGKLPGYNSNIDPDGLFIQKKVQDQQRVFLTPSSYYVNIVGLISGLYHDLARHFNDSKTDENGNPVPKTETSEDNKKNESKTQKPAVDACYTGISSMYKLQNSWWNSEEGELIQVDTVNAWKSFSLACIGSNLPPRRYFKLMATNESTASETFSNTFQQNFMTQLDNKISDFFQKFKLSSNIQSVSRMLMNRSSAIVSNFMNKAIDWAGPMGALLMSKMLGFKANFPQVWQDSTYSQTFTYSIKLVSPKGDYDSINKFINEPLQYLQLMATPITYDGVYFGFPQVWAVSAPGQIHNTLMAVQDMQITRGGTDSITNIKGQPTSVDVRITFMPLINTYTSYVVPVADEYQRPMLEFINLSQANGNIFADGHSFKEIVGDKNGDVYLLSPEAMSNSASTVRSIFGSKLTDGFEAMNKYSDGLGQIGSSQVIKSSEDEFKIVSTKKS